MHSRNLLKLISDKKETILEIVVFVLLLLPNQFDLDISYIPLHTYRNKLHFLQKLKHLQSSLRDALLDSIKISVFISLIKYIIGKSNVKLRFRWYEFD